MDIFDLIKENRQVFKTIIEKLERIEKSDEHPKTL
jgi:hypothetical protein